MILQIITKGQTMKQSGEEKLIDETNKNYTEKFYAFMYSDGQHSFKVENTSSVFSGDSK